MFKKMGISEKLAKRMVIAGIAVAIFTYHLLVINQYNSPDCIVEGITYYSNAHWSLQGGGRFMTKYISLLTNNVVIPLISVAFQVICSFLSAIMLKELWNVKDDITLILIELLLIVSPTVIFLMTYTYSSLGIGIAILLGVGFVYSLIHIKGIVKYPVAIMTMALLLGTDQGFIGAASLCSLSVLIVYLMRGETIVNTFKKGVELLVSAILGGGLYMMVLNAFLAFYHVESSDDSRLAGFSFSKIMESLPSKVIESYELFIEALCDPVMKRKVLLLAIALIFVVSFAIASIKLAKDEKIANVCISLIFVTLIPFVSNVIVVIVPYYTMYVAMEIQYTLFICFALAFSSDVLTGCAKYPMMLLTSLLIWSYVISANSTFMAYKLSYEHINSQMQMVINNIYNSEEYIKDETPIMIAGFPDDNVLRDNPIYYYAVDFPNNPVFWEDMVGATYVRQNYFKHYFGIDAKEIDTLKYADILDSGDFSSMGIWPEKNSIKMIDDYMVVRFWRDPPRP